eukprot:gb/GECH01009719.1/.p1 GENE.gb/GECH01009719.1/~~gb/GECH01009719.1/.p1  ORF type:complete len:510 (+),score=97.86 gb/GECH01009719.1/:1-1530(+)
MAGAYRCVGAAMPWAAHLNDLDMQDGFVRDVVECGIRCLEEGWDHNSGNTAEGSRHDSSRGYLGSSSGSSSGGSSSSGGTYATHAAADMLVQLTQVVQPRSILECPPFRSLIESNDRLYTMLPIPVHAIIAQAVAAALLLPYPAGPAHLSPDEWMQTRDEALHAFVQPMVASFNQYTSRQIPFSPTDMARRIHIAAGILRAAEHAPSHRRRHLHHEIQDIVNGLPSLPHVCDVSAHPSLFDALVVLLDRVLATLRFTVSDDLLRRTLDLVLSAATPEYLTQMSNRGGPDSEESDLPIHVIDLLAAVAADSTAPGLSDILQRASALAVCRSLSPDIRAAALRVLPTAMDVHWTSHFFTSQAADDAQSEHKDDVYLIMDTFCSVLSTGTDLGLFRTGLEALLTLHHRRRLLHRPVAIYVLSPKLSPILLQALFSGEFDLLRDVIGQVFTQLSEPRNQEEVWNEVRQSTCNALGVSEIPGELVSKLEDVPQDLDALRRRLLTLAQDVVLFNR